MRLEEKEVKMAKQYKYYGVRCMHVETDKGIEDKYERTDEGADTWVIYEAQEDGTDLLVAVFKDSGMAYEYCKELNASDYFRIARVHRNDLDSIGFEVSEVDDDTMQTLADKMCGAYTENVFWIDLETLADCLGIPKKLECLGDEYKCEECGKPERNGLIYADWAEKKLCEDCWNKGYDQYHGKENENTGQTGEGV
jgi:hypothetical protein